MSATRTLVASGTPEVRQSLLNLATDDPWVKLGIREEVDFVFCAKLNKFRRYVIFNQSGRESLLFSKFQPFFPPSIRRAPRPVTDLGNYSRG
jgi:hypothetical protein